MKIYVCWFILLISAGFARAQFSHGPTIHVGYQGTGIRPGDLNTFVRTFNAHYEGVIPVPLKNYSSFPAHGYHLGFGYRYFSRQKTGLSLYAGYSYAQTRNRNRAVFKNGLGCDFGLRLNDHLVYLEAGLGIRGHVFIHAAADFLIRDIRMRSATVYQDGTQSLGTEYDLNGMYTGSTVAFAPGVVLGGRVWHFLVTGRLLYSLPMFKSSLYLTDYSAMRYRSHDFPKDFSVFLNDVSGENQENGIKADGLNGLILQVGLEFMIPLSKK